MNGTPSLGLGTFGGAAAGVAGGAALTAAAGLGGAAAVARGTIGAAQAAGAVGSVGGCLGAASAVGIGVQAAGGQLSDALQGVGARRAGQIASGLGDQAVQGWGAGTAGGHLANRIRAAALSQGSASHGADTTGGTEAGIQAKGTENALSGSYPDGAGSDWQGPPAPSGTPVAQTLRRLASPHVPHDGHAGGISIRLNHAE